MGMTIRSCMNCKWSGWVHPPAACISCGPFQNFKLKTHLDRVPREEDNDANRTGKITKSND